MDIKEDSIVLCGSTKFKDVFKEVEGLLQRKGKSISTVEVFHHIDPIPQTLEGAILQQAIHLRKICESDSILVLNVGGYIGESTLREIEFAKQLKKPVYYLESLEQ